MLPTTTEGQQGPVAGWISTSGWAAAARGSSDMRGSSHRAVSSTWPRCDAKRHVPRRRSRVGARCGRRSRRRSRPRSRTRREWQRARSFTVDGTGPWTDAGTSIEFVWQRHELFHTAGVDLARRIGAPLVLFVPALLVWQARQWSIRRPGWDGWLERHGELPALRAAQVVACGTDVLAEEVIRLGVAPEHVLVTPTGVDLDRFTPPPNGDAIRRSLGPDVRFVIGWVGSFRPFHVLDQLVAAAPAVPGTVLLFVGDGPERSRIEALASAAGVRAVFTGTVEPDEMPRHLAAMDVGVVLADPRSFHYSPLKVAEYLAAGLAVVAPDVEPLAGRLEPGRNSVLYPPGDSAALRSVLEQLASDAERVRSLRAGALASAPEWSWDEQVRRVRAALG